MALQLKFFVIPIRGIEQAEAELARDMEPLIEFTRAADANGLRRSAIKRFGVSS